MADPPENGPLAQNKGGGFRGGPKRWTGTGPKPARHIPWPEIFKHHLSLIEGHQKMIDMVRKHSVPGTGNHTQLCSMLESCKTMLQEAKTISRTFVPPAHLRDQVPLGSSSASMYPGYSPADHVYGTAAMEYGSAAAKARAQGVELKPVGGIEYEVGQGKGMKRKKLAEMRAKGSQDGSGSGSGSGTDTAPPKTNGSTAEAKTEKSAAAEEPTATDQPAFFIDTEPTPVDILVGEKASKRDPPEPVPSEETKPKKVKKKHEGKGPDAPQHGQIETEDIKAEVDERMKQKEEKRRKKEEKKQKQEAALRAQLSEEPATASADDKKRKRDSVGSADLPAQAGADVDATEKPKKKKSKKEKEKKTEVNAEATKEAENLERTPADPAAGIEATGKPKKKKSKKEKEEKTELNTEATQAAENLEQAQEASKKRPAEDEHDAVDEEANKKKKKRKLRSSGPADA